MLVGGAQNRFMVQWGALAKPAGNSSVAFRYISRREPRWWSEGAGRDGRDGLLIRGCFLPQWRLVKPASALLLPSDIYLEEYLVGGVRAGGPWGEQAMDC